MLKLKFESGTLVSHGASSVNMTFVVKEEKVAEVIKRLHNEFFWETMIFPVIEEDKQHSLARIARNAANI